MRTWRRPMRTVLNALCAWALLLCCSDSALWARAQFQCSDSRAANFNGSIMNQFDPTLNSWQCLYPLIRPTPTKWQSMPEYCMGAGYDWTLADLSFCYYIALRNVAPWPRRLESPCFTATTCLEPLRIKMLSMMVSEMAFSVEEQKLSMTLDYGLRWQDQRLVGFMMKDPGRIWRPKLEFEAVLLNGSQSTVAMLQNLVDESSASGSTSLTPLRMDWSYRPYSTIFFRPELCESFEVALQKKGLDQGCCLSPTDTSCGGTSTFQSSISCDIVDECVIDAAERVVADFSLNDVDYAKFPFDSYRVQLKIYVTNPYPSKEPAWWLAYRPLPPEVIFMDIGTNSSICNSSLGYSMQSLKLPGFDVDFSCDEITNTSLTNLLARNTDEAFRSVSTRKLDLGVGGLVVTVTFTRHSGYFERYYIFPMVLMGCLVCLVPLFNADLAAFIGTRLAFCVVAALLAMACSYDIKPTLGYQGQLTVIDHISVLLTLVAAIVAAESMVAYSWWSSFRCDPFKKGYVLAMDYSFALILFAVYLWTALRTIFSAKNDHATGAINLLGFTLVAAAVLISLVIVRRMAPTGVFTKEKRKKLAHKMKTAPKTFWSEAQVVVPETWQAFKNKVHPAAVKLKLRKKPTAAAMGTATPASAACERDRNMAARSYNASRAPSMGSGGVTLVRSRQVSMDSSQKSADMPPRQVIDD